MKAVLCRIVHVHKWLVNGRHAPHDTTNAPAYRLSPSLQKSTALETDLRSARYAGSVTVVQNTARFIIILSFYGGQQKKFTIFAEFVSRFQTFPKRGISLKNPKYLSNTGVAISSSPRSPTTSNDCRGGAVRRVGFCGGHHLNAVRCPC